VRPLRDPVPGSDLTGWAGYGYCASHYRYYFWGLRLHMIATLHGLAGAGLRLLRPARTGEPERDDQRFFKPLRQTIESIFETGKGQLDLERHGSHTPTGVLVRIRIRIRQRLLALTAAIWHNDKLGLPIKRSLIAYDH
jgi:hypothetical protein